MKIKWLLGGASALAFAMVAGASQAQTADDGASTEVQEVVVTGTHVVRDGYDAPSPTTVVGIQELQTRAPAVLIDALAQMPAFRNSATPSTANQAIAGVGGQSLVNLRGLGATLPNQNVPRSLVLLDGERVVPTTPTGVVDIAILPSALIKRVDVVTGGASATYGSDAVAGVVNFVLDNSLEGLKADVQYGISSRGDNKSEKVSLAGGHALTDRLHLVASGEYYNNDGVGPFRRDFMSHSAYPLGIPNPTPGGPTQALTPNLYGLGSAFGGVILSGPLRGTEFLPGGQTRPFDFCTPNGAFQACAAPRNDLANFWYFTDAATAQRRATGFARLIFDAAPTTQIQADVLYGRADSIFHSVPYFNAFFGPLTIQRDNAFLPASVRAQMDAAGITSFSFGRYSRDDGPIEALRRTETTRYSVALDKKLSGDWKLKAYASYGKTDYTNRQSNAPIRARLLNALDSVMAGGAPVCRVNTDANPANNDPACVPVNYFGDGSPSADAKAYYLSTAELTADYDQYAGAVNLAGTIFTAPAGPVSLAVGVEGRKEKVSQSVDPITAARGFLVNNPGAPFKGEVNVREGYGEVVAPILRDMPAIRLLEVSGAARYTDYSTSGGVTTWKLGLNYEPVESLRVRATVSRDIRAPSLFELYASGFQQAQVNVDPKNGNHSVVYLGFINGGNPDLQPEVAKTYSVGIVYSPTWLEGFRSSIDYYSIRLKDAVGSLTSQEIVNRCANGTAPSLCSLITRTTGDGSTSGAITGITVPNLNLATVNTSGVDFEASYRVPVGSGVLSSRLLVNYLDKFAVDDTRMTIDNAGNLSLGLAKWTGDFAVDYRTGPWNLFTNVNYIGSGMYSPSLDGHHGLGLLAGNDVGSVWYLNATVERDVSIAGRLVTLYVNGANLLDREPPAAFAFQLGSYDRVGTTFKFGARATF